MTGRGRGGDDQVGGDRIGGRLSLRARVTLATLVAAVAPIGVLTILLAATGAFGRDPAIARLVLASVAVAVIVALGVSAFAVGELVGPLRRISTAVERAARGEAASITVTGDDELTRLAEVQNRLAADLERRNTQLGRISASAAAATPQGGVEPLLWAARDDVIDAFGLIDAHVLLGDPDAIDPADRIPGDPIEVRADLRAGADRIGLIVGRLPATRTWERADQDLLELYAVVVGVAVRNAELFVRVEQQNRALVEADAAKDDFFRGVSHNLQTPLARIRAYAERIAADTGDRRASIVAEQSERLSRMVRQLLTVARVDAGTLRPRSEVLALGPRVRRTWEALAAEEVALALEDGSAGWLAIADGDQVDQVLWALLDNAVKYGAGAPVAVSIVPVPQDGALRLTVADHGPGVDPTDRGRLFGRYERGGRGGSSGGDGGGEGSGLGLYVSRALCLAMGGDLVLEPQAPDRGAAFTVILAAEHAEEG